MFLQSRGMKENKIFQASFETRSTYGSPSDKSSIDPKIFVENVPLYKQKGEKFDMSF